MSQFYGTVTGQARTTASRRGGQASGLDTHARTWTAGIKVNCYINDQGQEVIEAHATTGSHARDPKSWQAYGHIITLIDGKIDELTTIKALRTKGKRRK